MTATPLDSFRPVPMTPHALAHADCSRPEPDEIDVPPNRSVLQTDDSNPRKPLSRSISKLTTPLRKARGRLVPKSRREADREITFLTIEKFWNRHASAYTQMRKLKTDFKADRQTVHSTHAHKLYKFSGQSSALMSLPALSNSVSTNSCPIQCPQTEEVERWYSPLAEDQMLGSICTPSCLSVVGPGPSASQFPHSLGNLFARKEPPRRKEPAGSNVSEGAS